MGDPKKSRKKFNTPPHPWIRERIEEERGLVKEYGLKNKREIWKMESRVKDYRDQAKKLISLHTAQAVKEKQLLLEKLKKYGMVKDTSSLDPVLDLTLRDILERRLQTQVFKKGFAHSPHQARQFIIHGHITVGEKNMTVPSYIVTMQEESLIAFLPTSSLNSIDHPERITPEKSKEIILTLHKKNKDDEGRRQQEKQGGRRKGSKKGNREDRRGGAMHKTEKASKESAAPAAKGKDKGK